MVVYPTTTSYIKIMNKTKILIIEDEPSISDNIEYALKTEGFAPVSVHTGTEGLELLKSADRAIGQVNFALIILDIGLPDLNGFDICKEIRKVSDIPIIFLTARDSEVDRVVGLEMGGDDYVTKPFSPRELTARVRAVLRRTNRIKKSKPGSDDSGTAKFAINHDKRKISYCGEELIFSHYEYEIMLLLINNHGKVFSRAELMKEIWDTPEMSMDRTVDTHIKTIRAKLNKIKPCENPIVTHRGFGYSLEL